MYSKLFAKIVRSSIWLEPDATRIVWFMFIALMDEDGFVQFASVANVAHQARITLPNAEEAIKILEAPDPNSADPEHDGRRIERAPGGWIILNAGKYKHLVTRDMIRQQTRERVARLRAKRKRVAQSNASNAVGNTEQRDTDTDTDIHSLSSKDCGSRANESRQQQNVELWLQSLEADATYKGIAVRIEYGKMLNWCKVRNKKPTKRRFINWLNNAERTLPLFHAAPITYKRNHARPAREPTEAELAAARETAKREKEKLRQKLTPSHDPIHLQSDAV